MPKSQAKKYFFGRICAIIPLTRELGFKRSNLGGVTGPRGPKNHFVTEAAKAAVKSRVSAPECVKICPVLITRFIVLVFYWTDTALNG